MKKITFVALFCLLFAVSCNKSASATIEVKTVSTDSVYEPTGEELKIVASMNVKPEAIQELLPVFKQMVADSQAEEGCIFYNLHQDIKDSTRFIMLEEWKSQAAIDSHNNSEHFKAYKEATKGKIEKSEVSIMKLVY